MIRETITPTIISEASQLQGDLIFKNAGIVRGIVEGNLHNESREMLRISKEAWVQGAIVSIGPVVIDGKVDGNVTSDSSIELTSHANVTGILNAPQLTILPGALLEGECKMKLMRSSPSLRLAA